MPPSPNLSTASTLNDRENASIPANAASPEDAYSHLLKALHPPEPIVLELDILPSTYPPQIHHEHPALALPKPLLIQLYLVAHNDFFTHLCHPTPSTTTAALHATSIILLYDPAHLTAANFRKRHLQSLQTQLSSNKEDPAPQALTAAIQHELHFLSSLQTSPLKKHTKSSTLWHHRFWLLRTFLSQAADLPHPSNHAISVPSLRYTASTLWRSELAVVLKAGERHPRNYYAWQYARELFLLLREGLVVGRRGEGDQVVETVRQVHGWCLGHPRDVSGWSYLVFLMERGVEGWGQGFEERKVKWEMEEWVRKYEWRGASVEWFLKAVRSLGGGE